MDLVRRSFVAFATVQFLFFSDASLITLNENGYEGIVVAIHKSVPEDMEILENIKVILISM